MRQLYLIATAATAVTVTILAATTCRVRGHSARARRPATKPSTPPPSRCSTARSDDTALYRATFAARRQHLRPGRAPASRAGGRAARPRQIGPHQVR